MPRAAVKKAMSAVKTRDLVCETCGETWVWEVRRGRQPKTCETCRGVKTATSVPTEERLDRLDRNLKANGSHLSQTGSRRSYSIAEIDDRINRLEVAVARLEEVLSDGDGV